MAVLSVLPMVSKWWTQSLKRGHWACFSILETPMCLSPWPSAEVLWCHRDRFSDTQEASEPSLPYIPCVISGKPFHLLRPQFCIYEIKTTWALLNNHIVGTQRTEAPRTVARSEVMALPRGIPTHYLQKTVGGGALVHPRFLVGGGV